MEKREIELGIKIGNRHVRDIHVQALTDLARDLQLNGRTLTFEDADTLKELQIAGNIMNEKINKFYNHFADDTDAIPVIDEEDESI